MLDCCKGTNWELSLTTLYQTAFFFPGNFPEIFREIIQKWNKQQSLCRALRVNISSCVQQFKDSVIWLQSAKNIPNSDVQNLHHVSYRTFYVPIKRLSTHRYEIRQNQSWGLQLENKME